MTHATTRTVPLIRRTASTRFKVAGVLVVTFLAGGFAGGAVDRQLVTPRVASPEPAPATVSEHESKTLESENAGIPPQLLQLGLTPEQRTQIKAVIASRQPTADSISESVLPRVRALELTIRQEMMCALTAAQQQRWMQWRKGQGLSLAEGEDWLALVKAGKCKRAAGGR